MTFGPSRKRPIDPGLLYFTSNLAPTPSSLQRADSLHSHTIQSQVLSLPVWRKLCTSTHQSSKCSVTRELFKLWLRTKRKIYSVVAALEPLFVAKAIHPTGPTVDDSGLPANRLSPLTAEIEEEPLSAGPVVGFGGKGSVFRGLGSGCLGSRWGGERR